MNPYSERERNLEIRNSRKKHGALAITEGEKHSLIHGGTIRKLVFTQQLVSRDRKLSVKKLNIRRNEAKSCARFCELAC